MSEYELMIDNSEEIRELRKEYIQTETEYAELKIKYAELKQKYDELNDFSNSQLAKVLKENEELKKKLCLMRKYIYGNYDLEYKEMQLQHIIIFFLDVGKWDG